MKLSSLTYHRLVNAAKLALVLPAALVSRAFRPNVWLVCERPDQARDNGYCFYRYLKRQHPEQPVYYIIEEGAADRKKLAELGGLIAYDSWRHYFYYCLSRVHISAHTNGCKPSDNPFTRYVKGILQNKVVFLPHGVSYGVADFCLAKYKMIDLFICSGKPEYENVLANYGYTPEQVAYTGFPRLDGWHHIDIKPGQILLMPTWRLYLAQNPETVIEETGYFRAYMDLLNSPELAKLLDAYDLRLIFYLHHNMRQYVESFQTDCERIEIVYRDDQYDIQELLKSSALLITDYSSVHFDFAYMGKPVLYYQFDREEFFSRQYQKGNFDAERDGFGPVALSQEALLQNLRDAAENGLKMEPLYYGRMRNFYQLYDEHNCDRVYEAIKGSGFNYNDYS